MRNMRDKAHRRHTEKSLLRPSRNRAMPVLVLCAFMTFLSALSAWALEVGGKEDYANHEGAPVTKLSIDITECPWCTEEIRALAADLVCLAENEPFSTERLKLSIDALKASKRFDGVETRVEPLGEGVGVSFVLRPGKIIRDIHVSGEYPLFVSDVLKAMTLSIGDTIMTGDIDEQKRLITELYQKEGYADPKVRISLVDEQGGTVVLDVALDPGRYYTVESVRLKGNKAITDAEILSRMNTWRHSLFIRESGRFRQEDLQQDVKDLQSLYWQRGYPDCTIEPEVDTREDDLTTSVVLKITEGPLYKVKITGNRHFWSYTLMQDIVIFREGNQGDRGIRKSVRNMMVRYRQEGFLSARVDTVEERVLSHGTRTRIVEFVITEGPRTLVTGVGYEGVRSLAVDRLAKGIKTGTSPLLGSAVFDEDVLREDAETIRAAYLREGFSQARVEPEISFSDDRTKVKIVFHVDEGPRTLLSSVAIEGLTAIPTDKALASLLSKPLGPYVEASLKADETALADMVSSRGHPYVKVRAETVFSQDKTAASVTFHVDEGPLVRMGNIYYRGNFITRTSVVRRELGIEPGQPFSLKTMLAGQKRIRDMHSFDSVQFRTMGLRENKDRITLLIDMQETPPYYYQGGLGYVTDRGFYGNIKAGDRNLFGLNKHVWTGGEVSQVGYKAETGLVQQRIFDFPVTQTTTVSHEHKEEFNQIFGTSVWQASSTFFWRLGRRVSTSVGLRYEHRNQFLQDKSYEIPSGEEDAYRPRGILVASPSVTYDSRDSFVRPTRGIYSTYTLDISRGYQSSLDNFLRHSVNLRIYTRAHQRLTLAWQARFTSLTTYGSAGRIPEDQLAFLGGTMSVRGFDENMLRYDAGGNPVGGRLAVNTSMEARIEVTKNWEAALFFDTGSVRKPLDRDQGSDDFRSSIGTAMRYVTPIGPIGLMYGHKIDRREGESAGRLHISVGYTF